MKINRELYKKLLKEEKQRKEEENYVHLCLGKMICPECNKQLKSLQIYGDFTCECGFSYIG